MGRGESKRRLVDVQEDAYKKPRPKAKVRAIFSPIRSCSFQTRGIGSVRIATSVRMVDAAFAIQVAT